ncbi:MAG: flagellar export chaperone FliS [Planctomycetota bacterium]
MTQATAAAQYRRNAILTASPEKLVKLLYEGAIRHLERGRAALADPKTSHSADASESLSKAYAIVSELRTALDHDASREIAGNLDRLYEFTLQQITQANLDRAPPPLEHGLQVMRTLKEGWDAVLPA